MNGIHWPSVLLTIAVIGTVGACVFIFRKVCQLQDKETRRTLEEIHEQIASDEQAVSKVYGPRYDFTTVSNEPSKSPEWFKAI